VTPATALEPRHRAVLEELAALADGLVPDELPADVVSEAGRRVLDGIGCMLGGASTEPAQAAYGSVAAEAGEATLVGGQRRSGVAGAALANATALRSLDFMDGHPGPYSCHPSLLIPAVLAAAESRGASGLAVARAIVLGYELDARLQLGSGDPDITARGWSGSTNLALAVSLAVGTLFGLRGSRLVDALAIATVHAPTLDASGRGQMAPSKAVVDGMVAMSAVVAAQLADAGLGGPHGAYEESDGFVDAVAGRFDPDILLAPLDRFRIVDCYTKVYNAVKCAQSAAAAALSLRDELGDLEDVEGLTLYLAERDWRNQLNDATDRRRPSNRDTANHSVVYCVAAALVEGDLQAAQFERHRLADSRILRLIDATTLASDPALTQHWPGANPATVEVRLTSGDILRRTVFHPPGHPLNPITTDQLAAKVRVLAGTTSDQTDALVDTTLRLGALASVDPIMTLVASLAPTHTDDTKGGGRCESS
jgi:2-methylcitrate dehydratase